MDKKFQLSVLAVVSCVFLASCGGGDDSTTASSGLTQAQAAADTVADNTLCSEATLGSYYWEIGNQTTILASGTVGSGVDENTMMNIASASKWLYAAYVVEQNGGTLDPSTDIPFLNFTSGYANFKVPLCADAGGSPDGSVDACLARLNDDDGQTYGAQLSADTTPPGGNMVNHFDYNSGHMEVHASANGLGGASNDTLASTIAPVVFGAGASFTYTDPQLAGGGYTSASTYRIFLRRLLSDSPSPLKIASMLSSNLVSTSSTTGAISPITEPWQYGLGHWVEDNNATDNADLNAVNDGAFNSGGALGFYPWVSSDRTLYGIIARDQTSLAGNEGYDSARCGRLIRHAYMTSAVQTDTP